MNNIEVYDITGKESGTLTFNFVGADKTASPKAYAQAVRVLLQNWRQGTASCKSRSEVAFSGKKPWRQKGTGRARAGMASSPLWRKGGVTFGPQPRTRVLKIAQGHRKMVLGSFFNELCKSGQIKCLDIELEKPSTKIAGSVLRISGIENKKTTLFLQFGDNSSINSFANLPNVKIAFFDAPNAYDLTSSQYWTFLKKDQDHFKEMVSKWN